MFDLPSMYTLDRISAAPKMPLRPPSLPMPPLPESVDCFPHIRARLSVSDALQAAINSGLAAAANGLLLPAHSYTWTGDKRPKLLERTYSAPIPSSNMTYHEIRESSR